MEIKNMIDLDTLPLDELQELVKMASIISKSPMDFMGACKGKIMATLFYEPSTRTQMSFQTAMLRLGGKVIGFDNPKNTSVAKGETLKDTVRVVSGYADIVVMRHPLEGAAMGASLYSKAPVINAGDGGHLHPTQTLTDLLTLYNKKQTLESLVIGLCGDLKNGRTVHSIIKTMSRFKNNKFILISTKELGVPQYIKEIMINSGCEFEEIYSLDEAIDKLDVLYMTRIQQERFISREEYEKQKGVYVLDMQKLSKAKEDLTILHPLPRVDEIDIAVDDDPRACYFDQAEYGVYARMALIMEMLKNRDRTPMTTLKHTHDICCSNAGCVTKFETYMPHLFNEKGETLECKYCEHTTKK